MMRRRMFAMIFALLIATPVLAADVPPQLFWHTVDGGGGVSTGGPFQLHGTAGQADAGTLTGGPFVLYSGYWHPAASVPTTAVVLAYAQAQRAGADVRVRWGTRAEQRTTSFRVERSSPCTGSGVSIGTVASLGSQGGDYALLDRAPLLPACYALIEVTADNNQVVIARMVVGGDVYLPSVQR